MRLKAKGSGTSMKGKKKAVERQGKEVNRQLKVKERKCKGSGRSRKGSAKAAEGQGKEVKRQRKVKERK